MFRIQFFSEANLSYLQENSGSVFVLASCLVCLVYFFLFKFFLAGRYFIFEDTSGVYLSNHLPELFIHFRFAVFP